MTATEQKRARIQAWAPLLAIVLLFVALASLVAFKTPAWEAQDEPGHVANIESLVSGQWYGFNADCHPTRAEPILGCSGDEAQQAPCITLCSPGGRWSRVSTLSLYRFTIWCSIVTKHQGLSSS